MIVKTNWELESGFWCVDKMIYYITRELQLITGGIMIERKLIDNTELDSYLRSV